MFKRDNKTMKVILTGTTGMVGEGVLLECLNHPKIDKILSVSRKPSGRSDPKLSEYIIPDFMDLQNDDETGKGYDACFYCAGVSSVGMDEGTYRRITYDTTLHFAKILSNQNPDMTFVYVTGAGTDSSEQGRLMWARIKGKTENDLMKLPFKAVYNFRPAFMKSTTGQQNLPSFYKYFEWLYHVFKVVYPKGVCTLKQVGVAMIKSVDKGYDKHVLEVNDIKELADA